MSRKNWSNLFISLAALNLAVSAVPTNPMKVANWIAIACCLALGTIARRRMIYKTARTAVAAFGKEEHGQDMVEYSLLVSFLALAGTGVMAGVGTSINTLLTTANSGMTLARNAVS
ncbi:MAG: Flp family type IVb pilin [Bryobacteraceae bacterium]